jgi:hypothetical protein
MEVPKKLKLELPYDSAIPLLGICLISQVEITIRRGER